MRLTLFRIWNALPARVGAAFVILFSTWPVGDPNGFKNAWDWLISPQQTQKAGLLSLGAGIAYWIVWALLRPKEKPMEPKNIISGIVGVNGGIGQQINISPTDPETRVEFSFLSLAPKSALISDFDGIEWKPGVRFIRGMIYNPNSVPLRDLEITFIFEGFWVFDANVLGEQAGVSLKSPRFTGTPIVLANRTDEGNQVILSTSNVQTYCPTLRLNCSLIGSNDGIEVTFALVRPLPDSEAIISNIPYYEFETPSPQDVIVECSYFAFSSQRYISARVPISVMAT